MGCGDGSSMKNLKIIRELTLHKTQKYNLFILFDLLMFQKKTYKRRQYKSGSYVLAKGRTKDYFYHLNGEN